MYGHTCKFFISLLHVIEHEHDALRPGCRAAWPVTQ